MLSKAVVKARPSVLWCYKKELFLSRLFSSSVLRFTFILFFVETSQVRESSKETHGMLPQTSSPVLEMTQSDKDLEQPNPNSWPYKQKLTKTT
jgi:hypothetical protein